MKKFLLILLLVLASDTILAGLSIRKGTDTDNFGFGKFGISASQQATSAAPDTNNILMETNDALLLETNDKILME
jgi:hypothetical protein